MVVIIYIGCALGCYFLGSIPTGFLWGKARGIDVRKHGSGNIGATNIIRTLGKGPGLIVLIIDAAKGFVPVFIAPRLFSDVSSNNLQMVCCLSVIAGHNWTCWLRFKGGKGIATSAGSLIAFLPIPFLYSLSAWGIVVLITRYVSLGSIIAAVVLPIATWLITRNSISLLFTSAVGGLAIYRHTANIRRLIAGTENRLGKKSSSSSSAPQTTKAKE